MGWVVPEINKNKTDKKIAVVGSGPAGLLVHSNLLELVTLSLFLKKMIEPEGC